MFHSNQTNNFDFFCEISLITVKMNDTKVFESFLGIFLYVNVWQLVSMNVICDVEIDVIVGLEIVNKHCLTFYCNASPCNQKYWQKQKKKQFIDFLRNDKNI